MLLFKGISFPLRCVDLPLTVYEMIFDSARTWRSFSFFGANSSFLAVRLLE